MRALNKIQRLLYRQAMFDAGWSPTLSGRCHAGWPQHIFSGTRAVLGTNEAGTSGSHPPGVDGQIDAINKELDDFFGAANVGDLAEATGIRTFSRKDPAAQRQQLPSTPAAPASAAAQPSRTPSSPTHTPLPPPAAAAAAAVGDMGHAAVGDGVGVSQELGVSWETPRLTHVTADGRANMVDVADKSHSVREAHASARVILGAAAFKLVAANQVKKGDVLTVAQLAGIMGAKHTPLLIPMCHNIFLSKVDVRLQLLPEHDAISVTAMARTVGQTGVEMEALTAAAVASLTVYDMCKAVTKDMVIGDLRLDSKSGGKSGYWSRGQ